MNQKISQTFAALKYPNYRLWFGGQIISIIGTWMQATAQGFLIYQLTQSAAYLGLVGFASGLPTWLFTLYGGVIADRIPRRKLIIITQSSMMVLAFILALLVFTNLVQPWHVLVLAFLLGISNAFDAPARQAFVVEMVGKDQLSNAIALNSSVFNIGTVIGPAISGFIYAWVGPAWCFTINGISFIAVISALALMRFAPIDTPRLHRKTNKEDLLAGVRFVFRDANIRTLEVVVAAIGIFGLGMMTLMPAWASSVLNGTAQTNGWLLSARGVGSLIGGLMIAYLSSRNIRGKLWSIGSLVMPVSLIFFGLFKTLSVSLLMLVILGWAFMAVVNTANAMIQSWVPDELRGRVMSVHVLIFMGSTAIGSLITGALAESLGEPVTVVLNAIILFAISFTVFLVRPKIRQLD